METFKAQLPIAKMRKIASADAYRVVFAPNVNITKANAWAAKHISERTEQPLEVFRRDEQSREYSILLNAKLVESMAEGLGITVQQMMSQARLFTLSVDKFIAVKGADFKDVRTGETGQYNWTHVRDNSTPVIDVNEALGIDLSDLTAFANAKQAAYEKAIIANGSVQNTVNAMLAGATKLTTAIQTNDEATPEELDELQADIEQVVEVEEPVAEAKAKTSTKDKAKA